MHARVFAHTHTKRGKPSQICQRRKFWNICIRTAKYLGSEIKMVLWYVSPSPENLVLRHGPDTAFSANLLKGWQKVDYVTTTPSYYSLGIILVVLRLCAILRTGEFRIWSCNCCNC